MIVLAFSVLCKLVWVPARGYKIPTADIARAVRRLIDTACVAVNRPAAEAGLARLEAGGGFTDGGDRVRGYLAGRRGVRVVRRADDGVAGSERIDGAFFWQEAVQCPYGIAADQRSGEVPRGTLSYAYL